MIADLGIHDSRKYGDYIVRSRRCVRTIEMTFDQFEKLAFLRPKVKRGKIAFEETEPVFEGQTP